MYKIKRYFFLVFIASSSALFFAFCLFIISTIVSYRYKGNSRSCWYDRPNCSMIAMSVKSLIASIACSEVFETGFQLINESKTMLRVFCTSSRFLTLQRYHFKLFLTWVHVYLIQVIQKHSIHLYQQGFNHRQQNSAILFHSQSFQQKLETRLHRCREFQRSNCIFVESHVSFKRWFFSLQLQIMEKKEGSLSLSLLRKILCLSLIYCASDKTKERLLPKKQSKNYAVYSVQALAFCASILTACASVSS